MSTDLPTPLVRPSAKTMAFAIAVVHSKPIELSVAEYIRLLRQHIAKGRRENALSTVHHHLDRSSYWRSEYERMKSALATAENEAIGLRLEIDKLKARPNTARPCFPTKKRKVPDEDVIPVPRSPKKAKSAAPPMRSVPLASHLPSDAEFNEAGELGSILLRSVYHIHAMLKSRTKMQPSDLAFHIVRASSAIPQIVQREIERIVAKESSENDPLQRALTATARAVTLIIVGYSRLDHGPDKATVQGSVIYAIVQMFRRLVQDFQLLSAEELEKTPLGVSIPASSGKKSSIETTKSRGKNPKAHNVKENPVLSMYTTFLARILETLDPKIEANRALFEGFAYCVLERLGKRLYAVVFGHSRASTLAEEMMQNAEVEIEGEAATRMERYNDSEQKQIKLEAPYLLYLANRVMILAPAHLGSLAGSKASKVKTLNSKIAKGALAISAKECLQRTLINCIFGTEGQDEDDPFKDYLKLPSAVTGPLPMPKVKEMDMTEYFQEELWRCLGWDILAKEGGW